MSKHIPELLQQIRQVENEHNQLVDDYFRMSKFAGASLELPLSSLSLSLEDNVKQALEELNDEPSSSHLQAYNACLTLSESVMRTIRSKR